MTEFLHSLKMFIRDAIYFRLRHRGPGDLSKETIIVPINSRRFAALPGRRRYPMHKRRSPGKVIALSPIGKTASSN